MNEKISNLREKMKKKKEQVLEIVQNFRKMNSDLSDIKSEFKKTEGKKEKSVKEEDDTELSKVFE